VLCANTTEFPVDLDPFAVQALDSSQEGNVFLKSPLPLAHLGVQMVEPLLSAMLEGSVKFIFRVAEQLVGDLSPLTESLF